MPRVPIPLFRLVRRNYATNLTPSKQGLVLAAVPSQSEGIQIMGDQYAQSETLDQVVALAKFTTFKAKKNQTQLLCGNPWIPHPVVLVGLDPDAKGADADNQLRYVSANAARILRQAGCNEIQFGSFGSAQALAEGAHLGLYRYNELKTDGRGQDLQEDQTDKLSEVERILLADSPKNSGQQKAFEKGSMLAQAQNYARTWMETPSNLMMPSTFAKAALALLQNLQSVKLHVHDEAWARQMGMNAFLAVSQGSKEPLRFLEVHYKGKSTLEKVQVALVGKGVTTADRFDSGGISIKPSAGMALMKGDMGGAAVTLATLYAVATLALPVNVSAFIPLCENMPGGKAMKPGDVVFAMNGKSIEIDNTDAEGRLILADALSYAVRYFQPERIIDVATLTGAMDVALGSAYAGVFTNSDDLYTRLEESGQRAGDPFWRMPLSPVYRKQIKSHVADLRNVGGRSAGSCTAAEFLKEFIKVEGQKAPQWAHIDIAGVMDHDGTDGVNVKGMSGRPVRSLVDFIEHIE